jgi:hypothetical protein
MACAHAVESPHDGSFSCRAFPDGVPVAITVRLFDHREPYPGDHGVTFQLAPGKESMLECYDEIKALTTAEEAAARPLVKVMPFDKADWDSAKHPRGQPDNKGEFGPGGGSGITSPVTTRRSETAEPAPAHESISAPTTDTPTPTTPHLTDTSMLTGKDYPKDKEGKSLSPISRAKAKANLQSYFNKGMLADTLTEDMAWYQRRHDEVDGWARTAGVDAATYVAVLASTSPLMPWMSKHGILMNKNVADKAIRIAKANPGVDPKEFVKNLKAPGMLKTSLIHAMMCMQGHVDEALTGPKVRSFHNNIVNPAGDEVTMDTWMARALAGDPDMQDEKKLKAFVGGGTMSKPDQGRYSWGADMVREIAAANHMLPNVAQAIIWSQMKRETTLRSAA